MLRNGNDMGKIKVECLVLGALPTNCYFVHEEGSGDGIFFDPADRGEYIYDQLKAKGFTVKLIMLTHAHFDHIWGANELRKLSGAPLYAFEAEKAVCENDGNNMSRECGRPYTVIPDKYLKDGETVEAAGISCKVIATPGHTIGSCCYYFENEKILIDGDTLFLDSYGRTDLPTGNMRQMEESIKKLLLLPEDVTVYTGHGDMTTIGNEKNSGLY